MLLSLCDELHIVYKKLMAVCKQYLASPPNIFSKILLKKMCINKDNTRFNIYKIY